MLPSQANLLFSRLCPKRVVPSLKKSTERKKTPSEKRSEEKKTKSTDLNSKKFDCRRKNSPRLFFSFVVAMADVAPSQTVYVSNLVEKVKKEGEKEREKEKKQRRN